MDNQLLSVFIMNSNLILMKTLQSLPFFFLHIYFVLIKNQSIKKKSNLLVDS